MRGVAEVRRCLVDAAILALVEGAAEAAFISRSIVEVKITGCEDAAG